MKAYAVKQTLCYPGECPRDTIYSSFHLFKTEEEAKERVAIILRSDWETMVTLHNGEESPLWENQGYSSDPEGSTKYGDVYFSEDGKLAWECSDDMIRRVQIVEFDTENMWNGEIWI